MTSVSVFVEFDVTAASSYNVGLSKLGGVSAYGRSLGSAFVTVIGEVPTKTVKNIADAVIVDTQASNK